MNKRLWAGITDVLAPQATLLTQSDQFVRQAAVMVLITDEPSPHIVYKKHRCIGPKASANRIHQYQ